MLLYYYSVTNNLCLGVKHSKLSQSYVKQVDTKTITAVAFNITIVNKICKEYVLDLVLLQCYKMYVMYMYTICVCSLSV